MKKYLEAQSNTNGIILNRIVKNDEIERFATADFRWSENKKKGYQHRTIKKGEIYQFEFGKNFAPEMSYEHRGLVIGSKKKMVYVLPIFSYDPNKHKDVYHPIDYPNSKSEMYLLKDAEVNFIKHDSIIKLNDIRSISINRTLYQHGGYINPSSDMFKNIERLVIQKYFAEFYHEHQNYKEEIVRLNDIIKELKHNIDALTNEE